MAAMATEDVLRAARAATEFAGAAPLLFGGDLNLRPAEQPAVFERLREDFGLGPPTGPKAIDHLLARGLEVLEARPPGRRSGASWRSTGAPCGSPTTLRCRHDSSRRSRRCCEVEAELQ